MTCGRATAGRPGPSRSGFGRDRSCGILDAPPQPGGPPMEAYAAYLREQAEKYREMAETSPDPELRKEFMDLAAVCEQAAANVEDRAVGG
jgi:hypothetical protein